MSALWGRVPMGKCFKLKGWFEPPPETLNNFLISVGKEDPDVGLTLVQKFIFKISALWGRVPMGKCFKLKGWFEPPPETLNNFLISVGKKDPDVGLTLVRKFIFNGIQPNALETPFLMFTHCLPRIPTDASALRARVTVLRLNSNYWLAPPVSQEPVDRFRRSFFPLVGLKKS